MKKEIVHYGITFVVVMLGALAALKVNEHMNKVTVAPPATAK